MTPHAETTSSIRRALRVIPRKDKRKIVLVVCLQIFLGLLDLAGVAAIGVLGALAVTGVQSEQPGTRVAGVLSLLHLNDLSFQNQAAILGLLATLILVSRTVFSILITRRVFYFLSRRGAIVTSELMSKLLSQSLLTVQGRSTQDTLYSTTTGVSAITLGVLGSAISIFADSSLLAILFVGLIYVDLTLAATTSVFFGILGFVLYRLMNVKAQELGRRNSALTIESGQKIIEVLESYRESVVRNRRNYYSEEIKKLRLRLADVLAESQLMPNISKYILESSIVIGGVLIAGAQFLLQDARHAVATLAVFLASGSRIAPAVMRIQQNGIQLRASLGAAEPTLNMLDQFEEFELLDSEDQIPDFEYRGFTPHVEVDDVSMRYPGSEDFALKKVSLKVKPGETLAIVGPSGAGKTTLVDVLLGVLQPTSGVVRISGSKPLESIAKWSGVFSYVPQDVKIIDGTFRENVALGFPTELATDELVWKALDAAQLTETVRVLKDKLDTPVGDRGTQLSGGQKQRLGIARAFFTKPLILVLDEATSALDGSTEFEITKSLDQLAGKVTVVIIAHRLSTVRNANQVIYMDNGQIIARGTFEEVRKSVPDFDRQAQLMGL
jgi:ATP-binding cassette, subfamily B, bacterial PglK